MNAGRENGPVNDLECARRRAEKLHADDRASPALGIEVEVPGPGAAIATMRVREDMLNGFGICHGGLLFTLADTAFAFACNSHDDVNFAASASIDFLRPAQRGDRLRAEAREDRRGKKSSFYTVQIRNDRDEVVVLFRGRSVSRGRPVL